VTATVTNINKVRMERLAMDLEHQVLMWEKALNAGLPTRELFAVMKETDFEMAIIEERVL